MNKTIENVGTTLPMLTSLYIVGVRAETTVPVADNTIYTDSTTRSEVATSGNMTTIKQPPPSAISPQFSSGSNSDLCTIGVAGTAQTQILGISAGTVPAEENCIRLKNDKVN